MSDAINAQVVVTIDDLRKLWAEKSTPPKPIQTVEDLMERWGVSRDTIYRHVDNPENPLPTLPLSAEGQKNRSLIRFRLATIEIWESQKERRAVARIEQTNTTGMPSGYSGKIHTKAKR